MSFKYEFCTLYVFVVISFESEIKLSSISLFKINELEIFVISDWLEFK